MLYSKLSFLSVWGSTNGANRPWPQSSVPRFSGSTHEGFSYSRCLGPGLVPRRGPIKVPQVDKARNLVYVGHEPGLVAERTIRR